MKRQQNSVFPDVLFTFYKNKIFSNYDNYYQNRNNDYTIIYHQHVLMLIQLSAISDNDMEDMKYQVQNKVFCPLHVQDIVT